MKSIKADIQSGGIVMALKRRISDNRSICDLLISAEILLISLERTPPILVSSHPVLIDNEIKCPPALKTVLLFCYLTRMSDLHCAEWVCCKGCFSRPCAVNGNFLCAPLRLQFVVYLWALFVTCLILSPLPSVIWKHEASSDHAR